MRQPGAAAAMIRPKSGRAGRRVAELDGLEQDHAFRGRARASDVVAHHDAGLGEPRHVLLRRHLRRDRRGVPDRRIMDVAAVEYGAPNPKPPRPPPPTYPRFRPPKPG